MLADGVLGLLLRDLAIKQDVESGHATLSRDPRDSALAIKLKRNDLGAHGERRVNECVQNGPDHLRLGPGEGDSQRVADCGASAIGSHRILAADHSPLVSCRHHAVLVL